MKKYSSRVSPPGLSGKIFLFVYRKITLLANLTKTINTDKMKFSPLSILDSSPNNSCCLLFSATAVFGCSVVLCCRDLDKDIFVDSFNRVEDSFILSCANLHTTHIYNKAPGKCMLTKVNLRRLLEFSPASSSYRFFFKIQTVVSIA